MLTACVIRAGVTCPLDSSDRTQTNIITISWFHACLIISSVVFRESVDHDILQCVLCVVILPPPPICRPLPISGHVRHCIY